MTAFEASPTLRRPSANAMVASPFIVKKGVEREER